MILRLFQTLLFLVSQVANCVQYIDLVQLSRHHVLFCASVIRDTKDCTWSTVRATDLRRDHQPLKRMFQTLSWSIEWKGPYLNLHTSTEECPASCLKHVELSHIAFVFSALHVDLPSKHVTWSVAKDWSFGCGELLSFPIEKNSK